VAPFTMMDIKLLCGVTAFKRGEAYNQSGRVSNLVVSDDQRHYEATVRGTERYQVKVDLDEKGEVEAACTCPGDGRYYDYCKHVAAVLLAIHEWGEQQELNAEGKSQASSKPSSGKPSGSGVRSASRVGTLVEEKEWERPNSSSTLVSGTSDSSERHEISNSKPYTESNTSTLSHSFAQKNGSLASEFTPGADADQSVAHFAQAGRPSSAPGWGRSAEKPSYRTADQILSMFAKERSPLHVGERKYTAPVTRSSLREELQVQFICKLVQVHKGGAKLALELKVGGKRLYVVQKVKQFLNCVEKGEPMSFTKLFYYDPSMHYFSPQDQAILSMLIRMRQSEEAYRESISGYLGASDGRDILIAPLVWKPLLELLLQADSRMEGTGLANGPLTLGEGALPLFYRIAQGANEGYQLEISGLRELILLPAYDAAVVEGQLHMLEPTQMRSLEDLSRALTSYGIKESIDISSQQVDEFVQHVVPELRTLGHLSIDAQVRERIAEPELAPKLYIDFYRERITARLEFDYGVMVINPLAEYLIDEEEKKVILVRDVMPSGI